jgi:tRNA G18 (ribose-2'-O)-methylase SpoU
MRKLENNELERKSVADFKSSAKTTIIIVDDVRSLHNIGSVFRTADALIEKYIMWHHCNTINKEIHKTALEQLKR